MKLNDELLLEFCGRFLGYGNPSADYWFVGMEEGGGNSAEEIASRFAAWERRGKRDFDDMKAFCRDTGHAALTPWGNANAPYQKTWCGLIKTQGSQEDKPDWVSNPVTYQRTKWLTENGETCLLNLLPLPSPNINTWNYDEWSDLSILRTRPSYISAVIDARINMIREAILNYQPKRVTFVGVSNAAYWSRIQEGIKDVEFDTMKHPAARGQSTTQQPIEQFGASTTALLPILGDSILKNQTMTDDSYQEFLSIFCKHFNIIEKNAEVDSRFKYRFLNDSLVRGKSVSVGFAGRGKAARQLCIEWKLGSKSSQYSERISNDVVKLKDDLGQEVKWQNDGKEGGKSSILALYYQDSKTEESQIQWAVRMYPLFRSVLARY